MAIILELTPEQENLLEQKARQQGLSKNEFATHLITAGLTPSDSAPAKDNLFARWAREGEAEWASMTPDEQIEAETDMAAWKRSLNENRKATGERILFPEAE